MKHRRIPESLIERNLITAKKAGVTRVICDWQSDEAIQRFAQAISNCFRSARGKLLTCAISLAETSRAASRIEELAGRHAEIGAQNGDLAAFDHKSQPREGLEIVEAALATLA